jgi:energy-coupling factor transporter transmembrane protein EcfT
MIETILFYLVFIGIIYSIIKILKSNEKVMTKTIVVFVLLMLFFMFLFFSFVYSWKRGGPNREPRELYEDPNWVKSINFYNGTKNFITVKINFEYSEVEIKKYNLTNFKNKKDTVFYINKGNGGNYMTQILYRDSIIKLPEQFSIEITDSLGKIIKTYNKDEFFNSIEKSKYTNSNDIECKETSWSLKIK